MHSYHDFLKCVIVILLSLVRFKNRLLLKYETENTVSLKLVKSSTVNSNKNIQTRDKNLGIETAICFYEIEDGDKAEELE